MSFEGIAMPELIMLDICEALLFNLTDTRRALDLVMASRPEKERDALFTAVKRRPGKARLGLGREQAEDWSVHVLMANARPTQRTVGDHIGPAEENPLFETTLTATMGTEAGVILSLADPVPSNLPTTGRVRLYPNELALYHVENPATVILHARGIQGTDPTYHYAGEDIVFHEIAVQTGWGETCHVRVDVLSSSGLLNIVLAATLKSGMLLARQSFETHGLTLKEIQETDLAPRPQMWPAELYNRTLLVEVAREFALPESLPVVAHVPGDVAVEVG